MASPDRTHTQKHVKELYLLSQLQQIININTRQVFYNALINVHIDYASVLWDGCGDNYTLEKKHLNSLHRRAGKLCIMFLIKIPQIAWLNSLLVTSPTTLTPGITSTCQSQGLTCLKLAYPSLERPSGTHCLKKRNPVLFFLVSNVI